MTPLPTLEDVARAARVSTATVSRALNAPHRVRPETRARVEEAVATLGYAPDFGGRALASRRTDTVGAIIPTMDNAIFARGLQAMQETLSEAGITLLVATSNYDAAREARQVSALLGRGIDGLLLIGEARPPEIYALLERRQLPVVLVWTHRPDCPLPCVGFDNRGAAQAMAERVLGLGHRKIAMVAGITRDNDRATQRVEGVSAALAAQGIALGAETLVESPYSLEAGQRAGEALLARAPRPTAIICGNDVLAAGVLLAARARGLAVPQELSITGFDDIDIAELLSPPLTTVHVPHRRMGGEAARLLLELMHGEGGTDALQVCFRTAIVERASLAPPRR